MSIHDELAALAYLDDAELAQRYERLHGRPARGANRRFLVGEITLALLRDASGLAPRAVYDLANAVDPQHNDPKRLPPGATITRTWSGERHVVTVLPRGYAWRGQHFPTLADVARAITGSPLTVRTLFDRRNA